MVPSKPIVILFVLGTVLLSLSDGLPQRRKNRPRSRKRPNRRNRNHLKNCEAFDETMIVEKFDSGDDCPAKLERVCEFHWVKIPGGGKRWQQNPNKCSNKEPPGPRRCNERKVRRKIRRMMSKGEMPCFTQMGKSEMGVPDVEVNFPDGSNDTMMMGKFMGLEGKYIGSLDQETGAMVAMTDMPDGTRELTMLSFRMKKAGTDIVRWKQNGDCEKMEMPMTGNDSPDGVSFDPDGDPVALSNPSGFQEYDYEEYDDEEEEVVEDDVEAEFEEIDDEEDDGFGFGRRRKRHVTDKMRQDHLSRKKRQAPTDSTQHWMTLSFAYDPSVIDTLNGMEELQDIVNPPQLPMISNLILPHLQARFCLQSLTRKILIAISNNQEIGFPDPDNTGQNLAFDPDPENPPYFDGAAANTALITNNEVTNTMAREAAGLTLSQLVAYIGSDPTPDDGVAGRAAVSVTCTADHERKHSMNELNPGGTLPSLAALIAHEVAHNYGAPHNNDADANNDVDACNLEGTVMFATDTPSTDFNNNPNPQGYRWSSCTNSHFQDHFNSVTKEITDSTLVNRDNGASGANTREFDAETSMPDRWCLLPVEEDMVTAMCGGSTDRADDLFFINAVLRCNRVGRLAEECPNFFDNCMGRCHPFNTECIPCEGTDDPNCLPCTRPFGCDPAVTEAQRFTCQCNDDFSRTDERNNPFFDEVTNPRFLPDGAGVGCFVCDGQCPPEDT